MKKFIQHISVWLFLSCTLIMSMICYWHIRLPEFYNVEIGKNLQIAESIAVSREYSSTASVQSDVGNTSRYVAKLYGIFPIKSITVTEVDTTVVMLGGNPFGIKLYTDGVLIVSLSEVDSSGGNCYPAKDCGLKVGDLIVSINGKDVYTNQEVADLVEGCNGKSLSLTIRRDGVESTVTLQPRYSKSEKRYKAGLWVRDSSAGIGTMTFYDPKTGILAGLGHPVCDVDTGEIIPISAGEIVPARIYGVNKSSAGSPGELRGGFDVGSYGTLISNNTAGVYAQMKTGFIGPTVEIALKQEIQEGEAQLLTTVSGTTPSWYTIHIRQVHYNDNSITRNMIIEITDPLLLETTGGIVQGMSGSPIVQNGKLVGAVTHVLVNDPTRGYAIFAENMLETANRVTEEKNLRSAS